MSVEQMEAISGRLAPVLGGPNVPRLVFVPQYLTGAVAGLLLGRRRRGLAAGLGMLSLAVGEAISMADGGWTWRGANLGSWLWDLVGLVGETCLLMLPGFALFQGWPRRPAQVQ